MGFPSGHVAAAAAFVVLLAYLAERTPYSRRARLVVWGGAALLIVLVATARVLLRAHWPLDTVAGAVLGLTCAAAGAWWNEHTAPSNRRAEHDEGRVLREAS